MAPDFSDQLIYDQYGLRVTVTGFGHFETFQTIKLQVENNTEIDFALDPINASMNNIMIGTPMLDEIDECAVYGGYDVMSGEIREPEIILLPDRLNGLELNSISTIEFNLHFNALNPMNGYLESDVITLQLNDEIQTFEPEGETIYKDERTTIFSTGIEEADELFENIGIVIENHTDTSLNVFAPHFSVNGYMVEAGLNCEIMPGKIAIEQIRILKEELAECSITQIENIEFDFGFRYEDNQSDTEYSSRIVINF